MSKTAARAGTTRYGQQTVARRPNDNSLMPRERAPFDIYLSRRTRPTCRGAMTLPRGKSWVNSARAPPLAPQGAAVSSRASGGRRAQVSCREEPRGCVLRTRALSRPQTRISPKPAKKSTCVRPSEYRIDTAKRVLLFAVVVGASYGAQILRSEGFYQRQPERRSMSVFKCGWRLAERTRQAIPP